MKTPIQQLKDNYYKMDEVQFHNWVGKNIETLLEKERDMTVKAYDREVIGDIQNWYIRNGKHYYELHYKKTPTKQDNE